MALLLGLELGYHHRSQMEIQKNLTAVPLKNATVKVIEIAVTKRGDGRTLTAIPQVSLFVGPAQWRRRIVAPRALIPGDRQKVDLFNIGARNDLLKLNVRESYPILFSRREFIVSKRSFLLTKYLPRDVP